MPSGGSSDFIINGSKYEGEPVVLDKTFSQIKEAVQAGKRAIVQMTSDGNVNILPLITNNSRMLLFSSLYNTNGQIFGLSLSVTSSNVTEYFISTPTNNLDGTMPQVNMAAAPTADMQIATKKYVDDHAGGGSSVTVDTAMSDTSTNAVQNKVIKKYVDDHYSGAATKVTLVGNIEGEVEGYTSTTFQQIKDEIAKNRNIWLTINGETIRLASYKVNYNQSVVSDYKLVFFGAGDGALTVKYEVTASASSASLTVTGS